MVKQKQGANLSRFQGKGAKQTILRCLVQSRLLHGHEEACEKLANAGKVIRYARNKFIIEQGAEDDAVYFLLSGSVKVLVNDRAIATREAFAHLGEMSAIDPQARRSASVMAAVDSVLLRITSEVFNQMLDTHPQIFRRVASELTGRLRERNSFHRAPNVIPKVFIGSSTEGLAKATQIRNSLKRAGLDTLLWSEDVFFPSDTTIEALERSAAESDFAVLILTPDDVTVSRAKRVQSPRDNVIYELGLFSGALSRKRVFVLRESSVSTKLPSDLLGVTQILFDGGKLIPSASLKAVSKELREIIEKLGTK
ncbi:CRP/FNR family cyclic AMP-dependent transcriptional regulator [Oxalobacteraceae bacterium GrIS 2.11]